MPARDHRRPQLQVGRVLVAHTSDFTSQGMDRSRKALERVRAAASRSGDGEAGTVTRRFAIASYPGWETPRAPS